MVSQKSYNKMVKLLIEADARLHRFAKNYINVLSPCNNCGYCCKNSRILVTIPEMVRILKFTEMNFDDVFVIESNNLSVSIKSSDKGYCIFRSGGKCAIYPIRPFQCMTYPVVFVEFYRELPTFLYGDANQIVFECQSNSNRKMRCSVGSDVFKVITHQRYSFLSYCYLIQGELIRKRRLKTISEGMAHKLKDKWFKL